MILVLVETEDGAVRRGLARDPDLRPVALRPPAAVYRSTPSSSARRRRRRSPHLGGTASVRCTRSSARRSRPTPPPPGRPPSRPPARRRARRRRHGGRHQPGHRGAGPRRRPRRRRDGGQRRRLQRAWRPSSSTGQVVGGAVLEDMQLDEPPAVFTVAGHAVEAVPADTRRSRWSPRADPASGRGRPGRPGGRHRAASPGRGRRPQDRRSWSVRAVVPVVPRGSGPCSSSRTCSAARWASHAW